MIEEVIIFDFCVPSPTTVAMLPAFEREVVDTMGAGDVFGAAFLLRYYETKDYNNQNELESVSHLFYLSMDQFYSPIESF